MHQADRYGWMETDRCWGNPSRLNAVWAKAASSTQGATEAPNLPSPPHDAWEGPVAQGRPGILGPHHSTALETRAGVLCRVFTACGNMGLHNKGLLIPMHRARNAKPRAACRPHAGRDGGRAEAGLPLSQGVRAPTRDVARHEGMDASSARGGTLVRGSAMPALGCCGRRGGIHPFWSGFAPLPKCVPGVQGLCLPPLLMMTVCPILARKTPMQHPGVWHQRAKKLVRFARLMELEEERLPPKCSSARLSQGACQPRAASHRSSGVLCLVLAAATCGCTPASLNSDGPSCTVS